MIVNRGADPGDLSDFIHFGLVSTLASEGTVILFLRALDSGWLESKTCRSVLESFTIRLFVGTAAMRVNNRIGRLKPTVVVLLLQSKSRNLLRNYVSML